MKIYNTLDGKGMMNKHNVKMNLLFGDQKNKIAHLTLLPGDKIPPHAAPATALFFVIEGKGEVTIGSEVEEITANNLVECDANIDHGWENKSDLPLRLLVIKLL